MKQTELEQIRNEALRRLHGEFAEGRGDRFHEWWENHGGAIFEAAEAARWAEYLELFERDDWPFLLRTIARAEQSGQAENPLIAEILGQAENPLVNELLRRRRSMDEMLAACDFAQPYTEESEAWLSMQSTNSGKE